MKDRPESSLREIATVTITTVRSYLILQFITILEVSECLVLPEYNVIIFNQS